MPKPQLSLETAGFSRGGRLLPVWFNSLLFDFGLKPVCFFAEKQL
jgi:hypothetical protein